MGFNSGFKGLNEGEMCSPKECLNLHIILRNFQASNTEPADSTFPPYK